LIEYIIENYLLMKNYFLGLMLVFGLTTLVGCNWQKYPQGVVAVVNGDCIYLDDLESSSFWDDDFELQDSQNLLSTVKKLYQRRLLHLIWIKLMEQELKKHKITVTPQEVTDAENKIKQDYNTPDEFKQVFINEFVDYSSWKKFLKIRLETKKFVNQLVKPKIKITKQEILDYYKKHLNDFHLPLQVKFILLRSPDKEKLSELKNKNVELNTFNASNVFKKEFAYVDPHLLAPVWQQKLLALSPGEFSEIDNDDKEFYVLFLQAKRKAHYLSPVKAYQLIQQKLFKQKAKEYLQKWLDQKITTSKIEITNLLIEK